MDYWALGEGDDLFLNGLLDYPFRMPAETLSILVYPGFLQQTSRQNSNYATLTSIQNFPDSSQRNYPRIDVVTEKKFRFVFALSHLNPTSIALSITVTMSECAPCNTLCLCAIHNYHGQHWLFPRTLVPICFHKGHRFCSLWFENWSYMYIQLGES